MKLTFEMETPFSRIRRSLYSALPNKCFLLGKRRYLLGKRHLLGKAPIFPRRNAMQSRPQAKRVRNEKAAAPTLSPALGILG